MTVDEFVPWYRGLEARLWSQQRHRQESSQVTTVSVGQDRDDGQVSRQGSRGDVNSHHADVPQHSTALISVRRTENETLASSGMDYGHAAHDMVQHQLVAINAALVDSARQGIVSSWVPLPRHTQLHPFPPGTGARREHEARSMAPGGQEHSLTRVGHTAGPENVSLKAA
jgi:hypothetical protein